jgi:hypothetical protein
MKSLQLNDEANFYQRRLFEILDEYGYELKLREMTLFMFLMVVII